MAHPATAYAPFGETYATYPNPSASADPSFTGQNSDTVTQEYDFLYREYSTQGRWPSPDPAGQSAVNPMNPQSWNRYAYVLNNPLGLTDPLGLDCIYDEGGSAYVVLGDCTSDDDNGLYVPGYGSVARAGIDPTTGTLYYSVFDGIAANGSPTQDVFNTPGFAGWDWSSQDTSLDGTILQHMMDPSQCPSCSFLFGRGPGSPTKFTVAYTGTVVIPLAYGLGPAFTVSYVPSQKLGCLGGGLGASVGHNISVGPVMVDSQHARDILGGASFSGGYNSTPFQGAQGSINFSGSTGGYSMGIPGASAAATGSGCHQF